MAKPNKQPTNSTRSFVEVSEVRDSVLVLKNGSLRSIIEVGSTNFALKSADEQTAIIAAFQDFLNSIDFPIQIVVHSRKLNIDNYLRSIDNLQETLNNELLKIQAVEYGRYIRGLTELTDIMSKKFYIIVPYFIVEGAVIGGAGIDKKKSFLSALKSIFSSENFIKELSPQEFEAYKAQVDLRVNLVMSSIYGMNLKGKLLENKELIELFYGLYNPDSKAREATQFSNEMKSSAQQL